MARNNFFQLKEVLHLCAQRGESIYFCQRTEIPGDPEYGIPPGESLSCKQVDGWSASNRNERLAIGPGGITSPEASYSAYIVKNEKFDIDEVSADSRIKVGDTVYQILRQSTPIYRGNAVIYVFKLDETTENSRVN
jgi:hypothetical protein